MAADIPTISVPLVNGGHAIIDAADWPLVNGFDWRQDTSGYASRWTRPGGRNGKFLNIKMHRIIFGAKGGEFIDHINRNPLDNRRANLRIATKAENCRNKAGNRHDNFKGVGFHKQIKKWRARIGFDNKTIFLGWFKTQTSAVAAYNAASIKFHGAFASPNPT